MAKQFLVGFQQRGILGCLRVAVVCIPLVPKHIKVQFITANNSLCCGSGIFIPDPNSFHPGSALKNLSIFSQKMVSKLSEISFGLFIPDSDPDSLPVPDPRVKKAPDPGSGFATQVADLGCFHIGLASRIRILGTGSALRKKTGRGFALKQIFLWHFNKSNEE
jgi:hypothetical protein